MISIQEYERLRDIETDGREQAKLFDKMEVIDQIKYYNQKLKEGWTRKKMETDLTHKNVSALGHRFEKLGFTYNTKQKQYIKTKTEAPKIDEDLLKRIQELEKKVSDMENIFNTSLTITKEIKFTKEEFTGDCKTRSFRTYEDILNKFVEFCGKNGQYSQQDIIAQALIDFMKNYQVK